jgi:hypothetical protein
LHDTQNCIIIGDNQKSLIYDEASNFNKNQGCSDFFLINDNFVIFFRKSNIKNYFINIQSIFTHKNLLVHNEDSSPAVYNTCYMVKSYNLLNINKLLIILFLLSFT